MKGHPVGSLCVVIAGRNEGAVVRILDEPWLPYFSPISLPVNLNGEWRQGVEPVSFWLTSPLGRPPFCAQISCLRPLEDPDKQQITREVEHEH